MENKAWQQYQAVYVHIPFCRQKCLYCDFTSYAHCSESEKNTYVDALCEEIAHTSTEKLAPSATVYFGGGTPSVLEVEQLQRIVDSLRARKLWQSPQEATIEVNPGTVDLDKLRALRAMGFTRVSMGVQSLQDEELQAVGRIHDSRQALEALELAVQAGLEHINADVIYGLPLQTLASLEANLRRLCATGIDHISVYGLILEEQTPLWQLVQQGRISLPDEDTCADMYELVQGLLRDEGFCRYEISNYVRLGEGKDLHTSGYSRHNDVYWRYQPYLALGAGAVSFDGVKRCNRPAGIRAYIDWVHGKPFPVEERLTEQELFSEFMLMGLRRSRGASLCEARERFGVDVLQVYGEALRPYRERGLVDYDAGEERLFLTGSGMELGNRIFELFV